MNEIIFNFLLLLTGYLIGWWIRSTIKTDKNKIKENRKPTGYYNLFKDKGGEWRFNIISSNFKVIAVSEGYNSKRNAIDGIKSLCKSLNGFIKFREKK